MVELQILNKILSTKSMQIIILNGFDESYFGEKTYRTEFKFIKNHYDTYNCVPDVETFVNYFPKFDFLNVQENDDFLAKELHKQYVYVHAAPQLNKVGELFASKDIDGGIDYLNSVTNELNKIRKSEKCIDLIEDAQLRVDDYLRRSRDLNKSYYSTGKPELDKILGGWSREDLFVISARPGVGKTWSLIDFALASAKEGLTVGFYSGEMGINKIGYRLDSLQYHISNWALTHADMSVQVEYEEKIKNIKQDILGKIKIASPKTFGGAATVSKLRAFIEREKIDIMYIDQFSLLRDERGARDRTQAGANISEDLKNMIMLTGCPVGIAAQLNRGAIKDGKTEAGLDNLAITDRLGQDASITIGLSQQITGEGTKLLTMEIFKNREGEDGGKLTYVWNINRGELIYSPTEKDSLGGQDCNQVRDIYKNDKLENNF